MNYELKKTARNILFILAAIIVFFYLFVYWWFHNSIDKVLSKNQQQYLLTDFRSTKELPPNIYNSLEKYIPDLYSENSWNHKIKHVIGIKAKKCQCAEIYMPYVPGDTSFSRRRNNWIPFGQDDLIVKLFIEKNFTQKQCMTYNLTITDFGENTWGIAEAAKHYFNKDLAMLSEEEIISLYIIKRAPTFYSPRRNKERLDAAIKKIMGSRQFTD